MAESKDLFLEVAIIRDELEEQGAMLDALVRGSEVRERVINFIKDDDAAIQVLLAVDGKRTQTEIVEFLKGQGVPTSPATVSRKLDKLSKDLGLVALSHRKIGKVYHRTRLDLVLGISRKFMKR